MVATPGGRSHGLSLLAQIPRSFVVVLADCVVMESCPGRDAAFQAMHSIAAYAAAQSRDTVLSKRETL